MNRGILIVLASLVFFVDQTWASSGQGDHQVTDKRLVNVEDFDKTIGVGTPLLSPDGRQVAYASDGKVYVVAASGGTPRAVTSATSQAHEPRWSADGNALYFLSDRSGSSQVWRLPLDTFGEAVQLTALEFPVSSIELSPDESRLLLSQRAPRDNEEQEGKTGPWVIDRLQFKEDAGDGYITNDTPDHYFVYDLERKTTVQVTTGVYSESEAAWSPDGESIVFISNREAEPDIGYRTDLWHISISDGAEGQSPTRLTDNEQTKQAPAWSPDGNRIAYITAGNGVYGIQHVAIVPAKGGSPEILTNDLDRWVSAFKFSSDGKWVYVQYDNGGATHLARISLKSGKTQRLIQGDNVVAGFDLDQKGNVVARIGTTNHTADIYTLDGSDLVRLSDANHAFFTPLKLGNKQKVVFSSADGTQVETFVTTPPDFEKGRRYPTILKIHGGPIGQFTYAYDFGAQFFAANGYVVIEPNPRGSTGQGQSFMNAIFKSWGVTDYPDVIGAVDHVIEMGYADPDRLAVFGYSYGGYMTNVVITRNNRFKAAASGAGHSLIIANYGHDIYQKWYNWELGGPWEDMETYNQLSPLLKVGNVETPTIFLGGRVDWNVPVLNAELFYQSLKHKGIPTRLIVYPDSHHGGWNPEFNKDYYTRIVGWFDRYVKQSGD